MFKQALLALLKSLVQLTSSQCGIWLLEISWGHIPPHNAKS